MTWKVLWEQVDPKDRTVSRYCDTYCDKGFLTVADVSAMWSRKSFVGARILGVWDCEAERWVVNAIEAEQDGTESVQQQEGGDHV